MISGERPRSVAVSDKSRQKIFQLNIIEVVRGIIFFFRPKFNVDP